MVLQRMKSAASMAAIAALIATIPACGSRTTAEDPRTVTPLVAVAEVEQAGEAA